MLESATMFGLQEALRHLHDLPAEAEPAPPPPVAEPVEELDRVTEASITPARERRHDDRRLPRRLPRESSREERPAPPRLRREGVARSAEADSNRNVSLPNLARIRESKYLTPLGLSRLSGVSRQTIAKLECGEIDASPRMLRELAEGLGVEPSALTDWQAATA
jgi:hypothetical protein